jgi:NADH-quinone oxidoreductase subunit E
VCRSASCALRGGEAILQQLCQAAGIKPGETTADGKLTLEAAECLGACEHAPCMLAGDVLYKQLDQQKAQDFLQSLE